MGLGMMVGIIASHIKYHMSIIHITSYLEIHRSIMNDRTYTTFYYLLMGQIDFRSLSLYQFFVDSLMSSLNSITYIKPI